MENGSVASYCLSTASECWNEYYNVSHSLMEECYLKWPCFEDQRLKPELLYPLTFVYGCILVFGVFGNTITCFVISTSKYCRIQSTTTNRYLFNLALADLVGLISGVPFEIYLIWNQYPWHLPDFFCHLKAWVSEMTSYVSVLTIVTFSIERYVAICHSVLMTKFSASINRHLSLVLYLLWIVAGLCASPFAVYHRAEYLLRQWPGDTNGLVYGPLERTKMCILVMDPRLHTLFQCLFHASATIFFFLPLTALICLYGKMGWTVKRSKLTLNTYRRGNKPLQSILVHCDDRRAFYGTRKSASSISIPSHGRYDYDSRRTLTILAAVVAAFFICYAPYQAQRLLFFYIQDPSAHKAVNTYLFTISGALFYLSSIVNPILYNLISTRYRRAFRDVLCRGFKKRSHVSETPYTETLHRHFHQRANGRYCGICASSRNTSRTSSQKSVLRTVSTTQQGRNGAGVCTRRV